MAGEWCEVRLRRPSLNERVIKRRFDLSGDLFPLEELGLEGTPFVRAVKSARVNQIDVPWISIRRSLLRRDRAELAGQAMSHSSQRRYLRARPA